MDFKSFSKISRLSREVVVTEKIDGSNAQILIYSPKDKLRFPFADESNIPGQDFIDEYCLAIHPDNPHVDEEDKLYIFAGSRTRWLKPGKQNDNHAFAHWVKEHANELVMLGEGRHYGEWYGKGINRGYGLDHKRFALFNVAKWTKQTPNCIPPLAEGQNYCPDCCDVVPILYQGNFDTAKIYEAQVMLDWEGSRAVPGFMNPEGIVVYHTALGGYFKKTIKDDDKPKGMIE